MRDEKMKQLYQIYLDNTDKPDVINKFIDENIHAERYITEDYVKQLINKQKERKTASLNSITEEDKVIAATIIGYVLNLRTYEAWCQEIRIYSLKIFDLYLVPRYKALIEPFAEDMVDYEKELIDYKPIIKMNSDKWSIKLNYRSEYDSIFFVENLDKETLKNIKEKAITCEEFAKKVAEYKEEREEFLSKVYRLIDNGKDEYSRHQSSIYLDSSKGDRYKKHFMIDAPLYGSCSAEHAFNITGMKIKVKLISGSTVIAMICDREIRFDDYEAIESSPQFFDLDEVYAAIKWTIDNNCQTVALLD